MSGDQERVTRLVEDEIRRRVAALPGPEGFWDLDDPDGEHHVAKWWILESLGFRADADSPLRHPGKPQTDSEALR